MLVSRAARLQSAPSLMAEGTLTLQAEEIARRILGFGPFSDGPFSVSDRNVRARVIGAFERRGASAAFHDWLADRIGVWLDYTCMPQRPLADDEIPEFQRALRTLDSLVSSSTVVAFRAPGDDYSRRGWCAMEFFLGSERSFARGIFVDQERLERHRDVALPEVPAGASTVSSMAANVMNESYAADLNAFNEACDQWSSTDGPLVHSWAPDAWSAYRSLQGSGFRATEEDPNPFRRAMEAVRNLETVLIENWLMADRTHTLDIAAEVVRLMNGSGLLCSQQTDVLYVGLLLSCHGWIEVFKPLLRDAFGPLRRSGPKTQRPRGTQLPLPQLNVVLNPG